MNLDESHGKVWKFLLKNFSKFFLSSLAKLIQTDQNRLSTVLTESSVFFSVVTIPKHKTDLGKREESRISYGGDRKPAPPEEALDLQQKKQKAEDVWKLKICQQKSFLDNSCSRQTSNWLRSKKMCNKRFNLVMRKMRRRKPRLAFKCFIFSFFMLFFSSIFHCCKNLFSQVTIFPARILV